MSSEIAAIVGVLVGSIISGGIAIILHTISQGAEDKRLDRLLNAEANRQHADFDNRRQEEQEGAARDTRRARLQAGLDVLEEIERSIGACFAAEAIDTARKLKPDLAKDISEEQWAKIKASERARHESSTTDWIAAHVPKLMTFPMEDMRPELGELALAVTHLHTMPPEERQRFGERVRNARTRIDAEIIRGNWP
jgi:hypothetical protein